MKVIDPWATFEQHAFFTQYPLLWRKGPVGLIRAEKPYSDLYRLVNFRAFTVGEIPALVHRDSWWSWYMQRWDKLTLEQYRTALTDRCGFTLEDIAAIDAAYEYAVEHPFG